MSHINLYDDHKKLKKDFKALKAENLSNNFIISENIMLKSKIGDIVDISSEILAKVLVDKQSPFLRSIIINKGSKNNIKKGINLVKNKYETEASVGISLKIVQKIASTGVDRISVGKITHSAPAADFKLQN